MVQKLCLECIKVGLVQVLPELISQDLVLQAESLDHVLKTSDLGLHDLHCTLFSFRFGLQEQVLESFAETLLLLVHGIADHPNLALNHFGHLLFQSGQMRLLNHLRESGDFLSTCLALIHDLQGLVYALYLIVDLIYLSEMCTRLLVKYLVSFLSKRHNCADN